MSDIHLPPDIGVPVDHEPEPAVSPVVQPDNNIDACDSKAPLLLLRQLQEWITRDYQHLVTRVQADVANCQYLRVMKQSPHPVLVTQPSLNIVCRVNTQMQLSCLVQTFNMITIKEITAAFEQDKVSE